MKRAPRSHASSVRNGAIHSDSQLQPRPSTSLNLQLRKVRRVSIIALRDTLHPQRTLRRRLLLALAAVATIVAGLLAMHSLNLMSHHNEVVVAQHHEAVAAEPDGINEHHEAASSPVGNAADGIGTCDGACGMDPMLGACALALLVTSVLLASAATISRSSAMPNALARYVAAAVSLATPAPPSLHVLSISRT